MASHVPQALQMVAIVWLGVAAAARAAHAVRAAGTRHRLRRAAHLGMRRFVPALLTMALLGFAAPAAAACRTVGTQLHCDVLGSHVSIGTQTAVEPGERLPVRPQGLFGAPWHFQDAIAATPFRIEIQNVGADPSLCHRWGNETYCY
jgi:hypothetical protein